ncbi:hypothetical protein [Halopelagius longus]|uniref:Uncharacterized protein n=1 Tax=Halopelagius longus TaxID=1236180 RepID=A0A1H1FXX4_9EURY|nr:hypothetical protein [Halopelagius longus]RDI69959.1 hypothetical protein DWB78_17600 [Halopelagius longus]SDR05817.1 hypothetical protein SAMN05216278_3392 [Halopelagius longus]
MVAVPSLRRVARVAAVAAGLSGGLGFLSLMGAFGPISCWTSQSSTDGGETTVSRGCSAGIDYLLSGAGGNAPVLFFWAMVLLVVVAVGVSAAWTGRRRVVWLTVLVGVVVSIIGLMSIGWYFVLPTLSLSVAAVALTVAARRGDDGGPRTAT